MKTVKITVGTYGYRRDEKTPVEPIDKNSPPIKVSNEEAVRLITLGVAIEIDKVVETDAVKESTEMEMVTGHLDEKTLEEYSMSELKNLAKDLGVKTSGSKEELLERIVAAEILTEKETDEEPPTLEAADPE